MKLLRFTLFVVLMSLTTVAFAQSGPNSPSPSDAEKSFTTLKTLAGTWRGSATVTPPLPEMDNKPVWVSMRVTSKGNALVHEMKRPGTPDDPTKDDPVTMLYLDEGRLLLTHYCDAGNRPRMVGKMSPDGKTIEFDFLDVAGDTEEGHMQHAVFTILSPNHHTEDWTFALPGGKPPLTGHLDLQRVK